MHSLFQDAATYTGEPLNLNLQALQPAFSGNAKLFIHADEAKEIISAVRFTRSYGVRDIVLIGGAEAVLVLDFLLAEKIPVIYERIHELPLREWNDVDMPFKTPFLLHDAGIKVGIGGVQLQLIASATCLSLPVQQQPTGLSERLHWLW